MVSAGDNRLASLDLIRGVAVLGILTINIGGFAGPGLETISPNYMGRVSTADEWTFATTFLLFEGKMRALFTMLFGASMLLFIDRAEERGRPGIALQMRRLLWLALFGYLHFLMFWWGDILLFYALGGLLALPFCHLPARALAKIGIAGFILWHTLGVVDRLPHVAIEERVLDGAASAAEIEERQERISEYLEFAEEEALGANAGFVEHIRLKLADRSLEPFFGAKEYMGETLPLILIGMALFRSGFFSGDWSRVALRRTAIGGIAVGGAATLAMLAWVMPRHFPPSAMGMLIHYGAAVPHLLMAAGYGAALVLVTPNLLTTRLGGWLETAGKMAFSNYLGTTVVMTAIFNGWGLGLFDRYGLLQQVPFVMMGWVLMLAWSKPWLAHFRRGPLEWVWRSLVEWRMLPNRC